MFLILILSVFLVVTAVLIHYNGLTAIVKFAFMDEALSQRHLVMAILLILILHIAEILLFSAGIFVAHNVLHLGDFLGVREFNLEDYFHISAETFVTVGYGDLYPVGPLRVITSLESLVGVLLIAWSGTFTYFTVQQIWKRKGIMQ